MKWGWTALLMLIGTWSLAQEADSLANSTNSFTFNQEGFITNRSLITFEDNPALAGFDRRFNVDYSYQGKNLGLVNRFRTHSGMIDLAFGGDTENWGAGVAYRHVKEGSFSHHQVIHAHSARAKIGEHNLLFGVKGGIAISNLDWDQLTFPDMVDPRFGFVYATNEVRPGSSGLMVAIVGTGLRYYWKRLSFDYSYQYGPSQLYALNGASFENIHHQTLKAAYHFRIDKTINITPELLAFNDKYRKWNVTPAISVAYKNVLFAQVAFHRLNQLGIQLGYQFKEFVALTLSSSTYFSSETTTAAGLASVEGGVRIQFKMRKE